MVTEIFLRNIIDGSIVSHVFCTPSNSLLPVECHFSDCLYHRLAGQLFYSRVPPDKPYNQDRKKSATRLLLLQVACGPHIYLVSVFAYASKCIYVLWNLVN